MGMQGISLEESTGRRSFTNPYGFRGISFELPENLRFIRVTDFQGFVLANVEVTVNNTGGAQVSITDNEGFCEITPELATNITIDIKQFQTERKGIAYNTNTAPSTLTLVLEPFAYLK